MHYFLILFIYFFTFSSASQAAHIKKASSAVLVGSVYCHTCSQQRFSNTNHFISGATVAVACKDEKSVSDFNQEVKTNKHGEFRVKLPFRVGEDTKKIKKCAVKLLKSNDPHCSIASSPTSSSSLSLKSVHHDGTLIFSAGFFTFTSRKQPYPCNQTPQFQNPETLSLKKPDVHQTLSGSSSEAKFFFPTPPLFPPNPFQPPPLLPPNPFLPPPSPLIPPLFPPNPLQPPPSPLIPFLPIPGLTPSPPPPPPVFPFIPLPPFPPHIPGIPPASSASSSISDKTSP